MAIFESEEAALRRLETITRAVTAFLTKKMMLLRWFGIVLIAGGVLIGINESFLINLNGYILYPAAMRTVAMILEDPMHDWTLKAHCILYFGPVVLAWVIWVINPFDSWLFLLLSGAILLDFAPRTLPKHRRNPVGALTTELSMAMIFVMLWALGRDLALCLHIDDMTRQSFCLMLTAAMIFRKHPWGPFMALTWIMCRIVQMCTVWTVSSTPGSRPSVRVLAKRDSDSGWGPSIVGAIVGALLGAFFGAITTYWLVSSLNKDESGEDSDHTQSSTSGTPGRAGPALALGDMGTSGNASSSGVTPPAQDSRQTAAPSSQSTPQDTGDMTSAAEGNQDEVRNNVPGDPERQDLQTAEHDSSPTY